MQSSRALLALPAAALLVALPLAAQGRVRVTRDGAWFLQSTGGRRLVQLARGTVMDAAGTQGDRTRVTLDGYIWAASVGATQRDTYDLAVTKPDGENLRSAPKGAVIARLPADFLLRRAAPSENHWVHVARDGWVATADVAPAGEVASTRTAPVPDTGAGTSADTAHAAPPPRPAAPSDTGAAPSAASLDRTSLYETPDGTLLGAVGAATPMRVLSRSGDWSRVELDAWVKSADLGPAASGVLAGVSAAELRADPARYVGQTVRWDVQFVALETSDELRPDIPDGATYMLARGPSPEHGFVYVVVPAAQLPAAQALRPLTNIRITATVRVGKARWIGNPVVDLVSFEVLP